MKEKYKVSMVVAIYKSEKFLPKLLDSIMNQTYKNFEAILVDDGSPDESGKICDEYSKKDHRFTVIHKQNGGACEARNYGINQATGDYLVIIDGDDWLEEDFLEYLVNLAVSTKSDMAYSDKIFTTRNREQTDNNNVEVISPEDAACMIIYPHMEIGPWNKIYNLDMINKHRLRFDTKWSGEGLYFAAMAAQYSNHVAVGHRKIYNYRLNNTGSGLTNYNLTMATNALENIKLIGEKLIIDSPRLKQAVRWHIWKNNYFVIYLIVATDSLEKNRNLYMNCLKYIRRHLAHEIFKSEISNRERLHMIKVSISPIKSAKKSIQAAAIALANDHME